MTKVVVIVGIRIRKDRTAWIGVGISRGKIIRGVIGKHQGISRSKKNEEIEKSKLRLYFEKKVNN